MKQTQKTFVRHVTYIIPRFWPLTRQYPRSVFHEKSRALRGGNLA